MSTNKPRVADELRAAAFTPKSRRNDTELVVWLALALEKVGALERRLAYCQEERDKYDLMSIKLCAERDGLYDKVEVLRECRRETRGQV